MWDTLTVFHMGSYFRAQINLATGSIRVLRGKSMWVDCQKMYLGPIWIFRGFLYMGPTRDAQVESVWNLCGTNVFFLWVKLYRPHVDIPHEPKINLATMHVGLMWVV